MRYDFITDEILQNYKFFEIQFDDEQKACVHGDNSISIPTLGTQFGKKIWGGDLFINSKPTPTIDVSSFGDHFTLIFKYNVISYLDKLFLGYFLGFSSLYVHNKKNGCYGFGNNGGWWAYPNGFGNKYNTNYELAIEVKPGQLKIWLNGKLVSKTSSEVYKVKPYIYFGPETSADYLPKFYLNDVFCINKSEFLPDQYTVNWKEPWYELRYKQIYTHHNETFYSK